MAQVRFKVGDTTISLSEGAVIIWMYLMLDALAERSPVLASDLSDLWYEQMYNKMPGAMTELCLDRRQWREYDRACLISVASVLAAHHRGVSLNELRTRSLGGGPLPLEWTRDIAADSLVDEFAVLAVIVRERLHQPEPG